MHKDKASTLIKALTAFCHKTRSLKRAAFAPIAPIEQRSLALAGRDVRECISMMPYCSRPSQSSVS
jgi:hypothetical protein